MPWHIFSDQFYFYHLILLVPKSVPNLLKCRRWVYKIAFYVIDITKNDSDVSQLLNRIRLKSMSLPVTWGDRRVVNGATKSGSSLLHRHHRRRHHCHHKKNVRKLTEGTETGIETAIEMWTAGTTERGTWIVGIGRNGHKDQIVVTVGLPGILGRPGILPGMTS